jgi:hypothetical protein
LNGQFDITGEVDYNGGTLIMEAGADMAKERDYSKEWEREKERRKITEARVFGKVAPQVAVDFDAKCAANGTTKNAVLKSYIMRYTYENFDQ